MDGTKPSCRCLVVSKQKSHLSCLHFHSILSFSLKKSKQIFSAEGRVELGLCMAQRAAVGLTRWVGDGRGISA